MKKYGYHRIMLQTGLVIEGPVVVSLDADNTVLEWHPLLAEEPMVEWVGGTYECISH